MQEVWTRELAKEEGYECCAKCVHFYACAEYEQMPCELEAPPTLYPDETCPFFREK